MIAHEGDDGIRVAIQDEYFFAADSISIVLAHKMDATTVRVAKATEDGNLSWQSVEVGVAIDNPTLRIPHVSARALLDALLKYYQGASDMHQLRQDFLHERERVDKLTSFATAIAMKLSDPPTIVETTQER